MASWLPPFLGGGEETKPAGEAEEAAVAESPGTHQPHQLPFGFNERKGALLSVTGGVTGDTVLHIIGHRREHHSPVSLLVAGDHIPPEHLLELITEIFTNVDVDERGRLDKRKLQVVLNCLMLHDKPSAVMNKYGSREGVLLLEELVLFVSNAAKTAGRPLVLLVPPDLLRDIRVGYERLGTGKDGRPHLEELETLTTQLGLDMEQESIHSFLQGRRHDCLAFMSVFVKEKVSGIVTGERGLFARNWFPGAWYVRDRHEEGPAMLHLYTENCRGLWTDMGKILSAGEVDNQSMLISLRLEAHGKLNVLLSQMEPSHARVFAEAAKQFTEASVPIGVLSHHAAVQLINRITGAANLKVANKTEAIERVFELLVGDEETIEFEELLVILKLLGQHTEPEHVGYLLSQAPQEHLGNLSVQQLKSMMLSLDVRAAVPIGTIVKLKHAFIEADTDGDGALDVLQLKELAANLGLRWTAKDVMRVLGLNTAVSARTASSHIQDVVLIDFVMFMDAIVEGYGDPYYELRYRDLFYMMDADHGGTLSDDEVIPFLVASGLSQESSETALSRLLGGHIDLDFHQFAGGMFEEDMVGETFPSSLLRLSRAFSNFDPYNEKPTNISRETLGILFRKLGAKFTIADRDTLFAMMDPQGVGSVSFRDFCLSFKAVDHEKIGNLSKFYSVAVLAATTSYELTSTVRELDQLRDLSGRPKLERRAIALLEADAKVLAAAADMEAQRTALRVEGALDSVAPDAEKSYLKPMTALKITLMCWFAIFRSGAYGTGAGYAALALQKWAKQVYPKAEPNADGSTNPPEWGNWLFYVYYIINIVLPTIVSFAETVLIYYDLLKTSLAIADASGIRLYPMDPVRCFVCNSIVSEVFELGYSSEPAFGINPLRGSNKYILKLYEMLYALRGGALKFILKFLLKKVATRSALRGSASSFGDWLTVGIGAYLDAQSTSLQMHGIRVVSVGRTCIVPIVDTLLGVHQEIADLMAQGADMQKAVNLVKTKSFVLSSSHNSFDQQQMSMELKVSILRAVAIAVVQSKVFHPNLELLMKHIMYRLRIDPAHYVDLDNEPLFIEQILPQLNPLDQHTVLTFLAFAVVLDGNLSIAQKINLKVAMVACNLTPSVVGLREIAEKYQKQMLTPNDVAFVFYKVRDREEGNDDITTAEKLEAILASIFKALAL